MASGISLDHVSKDKQLTFIVDQTVQKALPDELRKIDPNKITDQIINDITNRILVKVNEELKKLLAVSSLLDEEYPSATYTSRVYDKVAKAAHRCK